METATLSDALADVTEARLCRLGRIADRLLGGRPFTLTGRNLRGLRAGQGLDFLDYRDYSAGDDLRHLDWRASARSQTPMMRRQHAEAGSRWFVCLDCSASMSLDGKWPMAIQLSAAFAYLLLHTGNQAGLMGFNGRHNVVLTAGRGRSQFSRFRQHLVDAIPQGKNDHSLLKLCSQLAARDHSLIVISDFLAPDAMQSMLTQLRGFTRHLHALQLLSPDECRLTSNHTSTLRDIETGEQEPLSPELAHVATTRLHRLQQDLGTFCRGQGIAFSSFLSNQIWDQAMLQHLQQNSTGKNTTNQRPS